MILELLRVGAVNKLSLISECHGDPNQQTTLQGDKPEQHDIHALTDMPRIASFRNDIIGSIRVQPLPSARLPHDTTHWAIRGWPHTLSK
jgi:hypothetical protein